MGTTKKIIAVMVFLTLSCNIIFLVSAEKKETSFGIHPGDDILLNIVIADEQHKASQAIMDAFNKYWTCTKYEFIDMKEMKKRCQTDFYFLIYGGISDDISNPAVGWLALLKKDGINTLSSNSLQGPVYVKTDKKSGMDYVVYESSVVGYGINTYTQTATPDFYIAALNEMVEQKYVQKNAKRCYNGSIPTPEGMFLFDGYTADYLKDKTLLIDEKTKDRMLKQFKDEASLKKVVSKTTLIPEDHIIILTSDELCKSFISEKEDLLYMYTYYNFVETNQENKTGLLWMAPNIFNFKGKFVASLDNYKNLKKLYLK